MKRYILTAVGIIFLITTKAQPVFSWAKKFSGPDSEWGKVVRADAAGNVITCGFFMNTVDFDPSATAFNLSSTTATLKDIFVSKLDGSGNFVWTKQFGGPGHDDCFDMELDALGNIYVIGAFKETVDFDPGPGVTNLSAATGEYNGFVVKLDPAGDLVWAQALDTTSGNSIFPDNLVLDAAGNIYIAGNYNGPLDFDAGLGVTTLSSANGNYMQKLDNSGNFVWATSINAGGAAAVMKLAIDASGNLYSTGTFLGTTDFDPGVGTVNLTSAGSGDIFISKYDNAGNLIFAKRLGGTSNESGYTIEIDVSGNILIAGDIATAIDFDPGAGVSTLAVDGFILKLDPAANFIWVRGWEINSVCNSLQTDASGNVYALADLWGSSGATWFDIDPGSAVVDIWFATGNTAYTKLDPSGNLVWYALIPKYLQGSSFSLWRDPLGQLYSTGCFEGTSLTPVDFDPGAGVFNMSSTSGSTDVFVLKLNELTTGISIHSEKQELSVFPNPTSGMITATLNSIVGAGHLKVFDSSGRIVLEKQVNGKEVCLDLSKYEKGIYLISVFTERKVMTKRVIVE